MPPQIFDRKKKQFSMKYWFQQFRSGKKMVVDKFCGCAKLETGGLVVGLCGIITNALYIYIYLPPILEKFKYGVLDLNSGLTVFMLILVTYLFVNLFASILLIYGTEKVTF